MPYRVLATKRFRYGQRYFNTEVVREYSPCRRTIEVDGEFINLPFPYIVFYWTNPELYIGFAKKPITSVRSLLYSVPLGNIYEYGRVCGCESYRSYKDKCPILNAIDYFWNKSFSLFEGTTGPDSLEATFDKERIKKEKRHKQIINNDELYGRDDEYNYFCDDVASDLLLIWSKLKPEQLMRKLYYCPRTFKDFLASPFARDIVSELQLTLTLDSEYNVQSISKKRRRNRVS